MWLSQLLIGLTRAALGATPRWIGCEPSTAQRIYFANHTSHLDTMALWAALPPAIRASTRPVAAADYWGNNKLKRYLALQGLNAVLIERNSGKAMSNPLEPLYTALEQGASLIVFPEGTRQAQALPGTFKPGLFYLAERFPQVELIPVYLENIHRCMPKGTFFPVPLICTVRFGAPLAREEGEAKGAFLSRMRDAVVGLAS
ncbi:MAG: 1-acyl-sn-glycerol-3-phosphate acyltransferase [Burkholderiales bacterium]|nr:1-acyl-sn-glycerol-3-phosphate acyltransferase [Burkholderiales bacterium]